MTSYRHLRLIISGGGVALTLRGVLDALEQLRARHRRRLTFLAPAVERRRPRIIAEDYAARHSIEHTLDRKVELRRLAPTWMPASLRTAEKENAP